MKWKNVHRDRPPGDGQLILLSVNGVYYLTYYDAEKELFRLKEEPDSFFTKDERFSMYWLAFEPEE
jgi:hypothetical protein